MAGIRQAIDDAGIAIPGHIVQIPDDELWRRVPNGELERWPMAVVFNNLYISAQGLLNSRQKPLRRGTLHHDEVAALVAQMRSVASRFPYAGPHRARLEQHAESLEQEILEWPARFFRSPPRGPQRLLELRIDVLLWTIRELRRAVLDAARAGGNERVAAYQEGWTAPFRGIPDSADELSGSTPAVIELAEPRREQPDEHSLRARADRLSGRILDGQQHDLIAFTLHEVLTYGPLLPDRSRRP